MRELDVTSPPSGVQCIEIRYTRRAKHHSLSIHDEMGNPVFECGFNDPRIPACEIVAALADQADLLAIPLDANLVAVLLDLMDPSGSAGTLLPRTGRANANALIIDR